MTSLAEAAARHLGWSDEQIRRLHLGGLLHDIGKLAIEVEVLCKPAGLSPEEKAQMRCHPQVGARMLEGVAAARAALTCVLYHHERWDGRGYPFGRAGEDIPVEARLLAIADAFDAMTSPRPYRAILEPRAALDELATCAGSQFDPRLTWVCVETWEHGSAAAAPEPVAARAAAS